MQAPRARGSIGKMPYRARHAGLCAQERRDELKLWGLITAILVAIGNLPPGVNIQPLVAAAAALVAVGLALRTVALPVYLPINKANCARGVMSFSPNDCWRLFRFRQADIVEMFTLLNLPAVFQLSGAHAGFVPAEYAMLYVLHRLHTPGVLIDDEDTWGRDYTALSRVFHVALAWLHENHSNKVMGNVAWYELRFDMYNEAIRRKILRCPLNPVAGQIPHNLNDIFAFLDCTANEICRPGGHDNAQNAFWNG
jgi:hypothetical protein